MSKSLQDRPAPVKGGEAHARAWHHGQTILGPETGSERGLYQVEVERIARIWAADMNLISYIGEGETVGALQVRELLRSDGSGRSRLESRGGRYFLNPEITAAAGECLSGKRRFRPVLICDREAAHYWQLPTCWEGRASGEWSLAGT